MKFVVSSNELYQQLQTVAKVINSKSSAAVPVLENILFSLSGAELTLVAADQSNRMTSKLSVESLEGDGSFAVRADTILNALRELPDQPIELEVQEGKANLVYSNGHYSFLAIDSDSFPESIAFDPEHSIELPAPALLRAIESTVFAASDNERRPIMTGVFLDFFEEKLVAVASDGRILVRYTDNNIKSGQQMSFCLPSRIAALLSRYLLVKETGMVRIRFNQQNVSFELPHVELTARLLEGKYPNYNSVIPPSSTHHITVDLPLLISASKRVALFASKASTLIIFDFTEGSARISAQDFDISTSAEETIPASGQAAGSLVRIGFDYNCLQSLLQSFAGEQIEIALTDQTRAGIITPLQTEEGIEICTLIIPMKLIGE